MTLDPSSLPPFLKESPQDIESLPLQVSLLTMEVAEHRMRWAAMAAQLQDWATRATAAGAPTALAIELRAMADLIAPPALPADLLAITTEAADARGNGNDNDQR